MKAYKRHLITSALPYVNGPIHLGHIAGAYLPADFYAKYLRMKGEDVAFICGSDEHGAAITLRAKKEGITPQEIVDKYDAICRKAFKDLGIEFDIYHRTSSELHHQTAKEFFLELEKNNVFEVKTSEQYFDQEMNQFLADRYIQGECPKCSYDAAYGDQCENCGSTLSPTELINPKSTLTGNKPVLKETSHWYLPLNKFEKWLNEFVVEGKDDGKQHHDVKAWKNQVIGQCKSWIDAGLRPRAMTRDLDWGVKVPLENAEGKVMYVWLDAPIGYISATKQWASDHNKNWEDYWKSDDTNLVHFIGKDNIVFHCLIFPALLKAHGDFALPSNVPANEFLNLEGDKFSTSRNWAVWLNEYLADHPNRIDEMRYVIGSILPENKDAEFTWRDFQAKVNNELVNILGNFVNRVFILINKYYGGEVPTASEWIKDDTEVWNELTFEMNRIGDKVEQFKFREGLAHAMNIARIGNKYLADMEPWKLKDQDRIKTIMNIAVQVVANLSIALRPFLTNTSIKLASGLGLGKTTWQDLGNNSLIASGEMINQIGLLFTKIEDEFVTQEIEKLKASSKEEVVVSPMKEQITFEEFQKLDIRVGTIISAEKVKKANKLLKLTVDTGLDKRTVVSGIAEHYNPDSILGKKVSILLNLAPRKIRGVESQGMILMAENAEGKLSFVSPTEEFIDSGGMIS